VWPDHDAPLHDVRVCVLQRVDANDIVLAHASQTAQEAVAMPGEGAIAGLSGNTVVATCPTARSSCSGSVPSVIRAEIPSRGIWMRPNTPGASFSGRHSFESVSAGASVDDPPSRAASSFFASAEREARASVSFLNHNPISRSPSVSRPLWNHRSEGRGCARPRCSAVWSFTSASVPTSSGT
jgi:hypothetical protein